MLCVRLAFIQTRRHNLKDHLDRVSSCSRRRYFISARWKIEPAKCRVCYTRSHSHNSLIILFHQAPVFIAEANELFVRLCAYNIIEARDDILPFICPVIQRKINWMNYYSKMRANKAHNHIQTWAWRTRAASSSVCVSECLVWLVYQWKLLDC